MKKLRPHLRRSTVAAVLVLATAVVSACSGGQPPSDQSGSVTLKVWDTFTEPARESGIKEIIKDFETANPGIKVQRQSFAAADLTATAKTSLAGNNGPDLIYLDVGPGNAGVLAKAGLLQPLTGISTVDQNMMNSFALEHSKVDGTVYGVPLESEFLGMYYNQDLLKKLGLQVPSTLDEMISDCQKAKDAGYIYSAVSDKEGWEAYHQFGMIANNVLGEAGIRALLGGTGGGRWDTPELTNAVQRWFVDANNAGCFPPHVTGITYDSAQSLFQSGKALTMPTGTWLASELDTAIKFNASLEPFPKLGEQKPIYPAGVGSAMFVSSKAKDPQAAGKLLTYFLSPGAVEIGSNKMGIIIPAKSSAPGVDKVGPLRKETIDSFAAAQAATGPKLGIYLDTGSTTAFNTQMLKGFQEVFNGTITPAEQLKLLQSATK